MQHTALQDKTLSRRTNFQNSLSDKRIQIKTKISSALNSESVLNMISKFNMTYFENTEEGVSHALKAINEIFLEAAKKSLKIKNGNYRRRRVPVDNKKWFDKEFNGSRITLRKISNKKNRNPNDEEIRKEYHDSLNR